MTCEEAKRLFDEKLDGILDENEIARLDAHLAECEACRLEYERLEKLHTYLTSFAVDIPSELSENVMKSIRSEKKRRILSKKWLAPLMTVSAAALLCFSLVQSPLFDSMLTLNEETIINNTPDASPEVTEKPALDSISGDKDEHDSLLDLEDTLEDLLDSVGGSADLDDILGDILDKIQGGAHLDDILDSLDKIQHVTDKVDPEVVSPVNNTVAGTPFTLIFTDARNAVLIHEDTEKHENVTYTKISDEVTIEKNGKRATLILRGDTLTPTDPAALNALFAD